MVIPGSIFEKKKHIVQDIPVFCFVLFFAFLVTKGDNRETWKDIYGMIFVCAVKKSQI